MTTPIPGQPDWLPDPTGRHEHRWWDGTSFTDRVADGGVVSVDPGQAVAPPSWSTPPAAATPPPLFDPTSFSPTSSVPGAAVPTGPEPKRRSRVLPIVLAVGGVVVIGAGVAFLLFGGDENRGTGTFEGRIDGDTSVGIHTVELDAGDALTIDLLPDADVDAVLGILVDDATADALEEAYGDAIVLDRRPLSEVFGVDAADLETTADQVLLRTDLGFPGEHEQLVLAATADMEMSAIVGPFEAGTDVGGYEITLEVFALDVTDTSDGGELLDAVASNEVSGDEPIPADFRRVAEELLATGSG